MPNELKIEKVKAYLCQIGIGCSYATHQLDTASSLIVEITSGGLHGWGEVFLPKIEPQWTWVDSAIPLLIGKNALELDKLLDLWPEENRPKMSLKDCSTYCHPEVDLVAEAVSFALYDLVAKSREIPLREQIGTSKRTVIPGMPCVTIDTPETMARIAKGWSKLGYKYVKIKLKGEAKADSETVRIVREAVGYDIQLQVDANNSYIGIASAEKLIEALNQYEVEVIEDLFEVGAVEDCAAACQRLTGKYMVDKDAHWPHVKNILNKNAADLVNQHPHNQGRVSYALKIAEVAEKAGLESAIGASGILGIQNTCYQQLSAVIGLSRPCEDIGFYSYYDSGIADSFHFSARPSVLKAEQPIINGEIRLNDKPGIGVEIDKDKLESFTVDRKVFK